MTNTFIVSGEIDLMFDNLPPQLPHIGSGKVRALAVTSLKRSSALPDVPTLDEVGLKGYEVTAWFGLAVPAATPRETLAKLNQALNASTNDPQVREALESRGATIVQHTPEDAYAFVKNEITKWEPVVKRAGVVPD